ncbi:MAG TPA: class I SAM-dependent methyltransferase [Gaiellaceae bacterium]
MHGSTDSPLVCLGCRREYVRHGALLDFLPSEPPDDDVATQWPLWEELEQNGSVAYQNDPSGNLSVAPRKDCAAFRAFAQLEGLVLDVGCGPQPLPWYGTAFDGTFVGIDPLVGASPRAFAFVRGLGEYLPFRSDVFDRVLFTTSLDHVIVPHRALAEARRVVRPGGHVCIWFAEGSSAATTRTAPSNAWYDELKVPDGAVDRFHAVRFTEGLVEELVKDAGLSVVEMERFDNTPSIFLRAVG